MLGSKKTVGQTEQGRCLEVQGNGHEPKSIYKRQRKGIKQRTAESRHANLKEFTGFYVRGIIYDSSQGKNSIKAKVGKQETPAEI